MLKMIGCHITPCYLSSKYTSDIDSTYRTHSSLIDRLLNSVALKTRDIPEV